MLMNGKFVVIGSYWNSTEVWGPFDSIEDAKAAVEKHAEQVHENEGTWVGMTYESESGYLFCKIEQRCNVVLLGD